MSRHSSLRRFYRVILFFLYLISALFLGLLSYSILRVALLDPYEIAASIKDYVRRDPGRLSPLIEQSYPRPDQLDGLKAGDVCIQVYGGSSVVVSDTMRDAFSDHLEYMLRKYNPRLKVINFGVATYDLLDVKRRIMMVFRELKVRPKLIVIYSGHNDYAQMYHSVVDRYNRFQWLLVPAYSLLSPEEKNLLVLKTFMRLKTAVIIKWLQVLHIVDLREEAYASVNEMILERFRRNEEEIRRFLEPFGIPVLYVTPISNLRAEPYGDVRSTARLYRKGIESDDYEEAISSLIRAKDAEILTHDVRVKTPLNDFLRQLRQENVYVLDLENQLRRRRSAFGDELFTDYLHLTIQAHRLIAQSLKEFILGEKRLRGSLGLSS
ncbi:MAG TPA: hypothetical protein PK876_04215 [Elusimicrobiota bacterium]|nr:hypothetical protein [Elusimicrobiota bacterium]